MALFAPLAQSEHRPFVKICGLRVAHHAVVAAQSGAALLGLMFAPSKRRVELVEAEAIVAALRDAGCLTPTVGIFVNEQPATINRIADQCDLAAIQLSGDEQPAILADIARPVIVGIRLCDDERERGWLELARRYPQRVLPLVDAHLPGSYGGSGVIADWVGAAALAADLPLLLAGGLNPENVAEALAAVRPLGVDVSSGVESGGEKDPEKIRSFLRAVHSSTVER